MFKNFLLKSLIIAITMIGITPGLLTNQTAHAASEPCPPSWTAEEINGAQLCKKEVNQVDPEAYQCTLAEGMFNSKPKSPSAGNTLYCSPAPTNVNEEAKERIANTVGFMVEIQGFLNKLIWPILAMNGKLLDNRFLFGNGMEEHLRAIWVPIRDLVNIIFVIVLLIIALYNVLGINNDGNLAIKSALPKVIVGILAVNFSFFIMKVVLDATNVVTTAVFSIPTEIELGIPDIADNELVVQNMCLSMGELGTEDLSKLSSDEQSTFSETARINYGKQQLQDNPSKFGLTTANSTKINKATSFDDLLKLLPDENTAQFQELIDRQVSKGSFCTVTKGDDGIKRYSLTPTGRNFVNKYNSQNAAFLMAVNLGKIVFYNNIDVTTLDFSTFTINTIFSVVLYLVYVVSFLVLFIVLLGRLIFLWLSIAISPILLILIASPDLKSKLSGLDQLTDGFFKNAFAPIIIGVVMTIGWIMLRAIQGVTILSTNESIDLSTPSGIPIVGLSSLQDFMVAVGTIAVVWIGVFAAAKGTIVEGVVNSIESVSKGAAKFIATAPLKYGQFIPIKDAKGNDGYSLSEISDAGRRAFSNLTDSTRLSRRLGFLGNSSGKVESAKKATNAKELAQQFKAAVDNRHLNQEWLKELQSKPQLVKDITRELKNSGATTDQTLAWSELSTKTNLSNARIQQLGKIAASSSYFQNSDSEKTSKPAKKKDKTSSSKSNPNPNPNPPKDYSVKINNLNLGMIASQNIPQDHPEGTAYKGKIQNLVTELQKDKPDPKTSLQNLKINHNGTPIAPTPKELKDQLNQIDPELYTKLLEAITPNSEETKEQALQRLLGTNTTE